MLNQTIKHFIFLLLLICALFVWIGMALIGLFLAFTNYGFMYNITPFIGFISAICIIKCAMYVLKSNPILYFEESSTKLKALFK